MDLSFLQSPHEYDPRRNFSVTATDWQQRVNFQRLREERLERARQKMEEHDLGGLILFKGENIRYVTSVYQGNWKNNIFIRYAVLPRGGDPVLFETVGSDLECAKIDAPWLKGNIRPAMTWKWAEEAEDMMAKKMANGIHEVLKENNVQNEKIGIDKMDLKAYNALEDKGINLVNAWPVMSGARVVKTKDEIELLKISSAYGDAAMWKIKNEWLKPGVKESYITAKVNEFLYEEGFDHVYDIIVATGGNTNPYRRWHTDRLVRHGDLVIVDANAIGPGGYFVDFVRCFKVGDNWTEQEKDLYKECYESLYGAMEEMKPGNTTKDVAEKFPEYADDETGSVSLQQFAHSIGLDLYEGMWISRAYSMEYPAEIKQNMTFAIETFTGRPGLKQAVRLEENLVITDDGYQLLTLAPHQAGFGE